MSEIKSFPFPVLSPSNMDYSDNCSYSAESSRIQKDCNLLIQHHIEGKNLVGTLINEKRAAFACIVSLPATMYRRVFVSDTTELECRQVIPYAESGYGQNDVSIDPPMFRPIIIAKEEINIKSTLEHQLNFHWKNTDITIPKGAIIAYDFWQRFGGDIGGLLIIQIDERLPEGALYVEEEVDGGFRFRVRVDQKLYDNLKSLTPGQKCYRQRTSVLTHALSAGFSILKEKYRDNEWKEHSNLRLLYDKLKQENLSTWMEDDFSPEKTATLLHPHIFPLNDDEEYDD